MRWRDAWVETKLDADALAEAGVRPGSRVVPSADRKRPVRLGPDGEYVASHAIDDKGVGRRAARAGRAADVAPAHVELVFTAREEIGCHGAKWYASRTDAEAPSRSRSRRSRRSTASIPGPTRCSWRRTGSARSRTR